MSSLMSIRISSKKNELYEFWDAEDFDEARIDILAERRAKGAREDYDKEINAKLSKLERAENYGNLTHRFAPKQMQAAKWIWKEFGDDFADVMTDNGLNREKADELAKVIL